jgi:hypothetical protein
MHSESSPRQVNSGFCDPVYTISSGTTKRQLGREMRYNELLLYWEAAVDQKSYLKANQGLMTTIMTMLLW